MRAGLAAILVLVFLGTGAAATAIAQRTFPGDAEAAIPFGAEQTASIDMRRPDSRVLRWNETMNLTSAQRHTAWVQVPWSLNGPRSSFGRVETFLNISVNGREPDGGFYTLYPRNNVRSKVPAVEEGFDRSALAAGQNRVEVTFTLKVKEQDDGIATFAAGPLLLRGVEAEGRDPLALLLLPWGVAAVVSAGTGLVLRARAK